MHPALGLESVPWKEQRRDHEIGNQFPWLVSSVFERRPRRCVPVTWREVHGHQVLTADTLTIEAETSDPRACATGTALKLLASVAFRWNLNVAPSCWLEQVQKPRRHRQEQDQNKAFSCQRLTGSHWELNTLTFLLRCGQKYFVIASAFLVFLFFFSPLLNQLAGALRRSIGTSAWVSTHRDKMYGLLCESLHDFIKESYGDDVWKLVRERADVRLHSFVTHQVRWSCGELQCCLTVIALLLKPFCSPRHQNVFTPPLRVSRCTARVWYPVLPRQPAEWQGPPTMSWWTLGASTSWALLENTDMTEFSRWKKEKPWLKLLMLTFFICVLVNAFFKFIVLAHFICLWTFC